MINEAVIVILDSKNQQTLAISPVRGIVKGCRIYTKKFVRINLDELTDPLTIGKVDYAKIDATTEEDIARHIQEDILESRRVAGEEMQEIRERMGMSEMCFADALHISVETLNDWEQGIRLPTGPARILLKILEAEPGMALEVLRGSEITRGKALGLPPMPDEGANQD